MSCLFYWELPWQNDFKYFALQHFFFNCSFKEQGQQNQKAVAGWGDAIWPETKLAYGVSPMPLSKNSFLLKHYHSQFTDTISLAFLRSPHEVST